MDELIQVETVDGRTSFRPGDAIDGTVRWKLPKPPKTIELRLFWSTEGRGDQDLQVVETVPFESPEAQDQRAFRIRLPEGPYSFSGHLITLHWALEAVAEPGDEAGSCFITVSPTGEEIRLDR
ncbi:MAG TPA: hypothetical protein VEW48_08520 [Thermoanaerobaculia bacterium]|nr:hypothetical protein [Thermoanaerobaculia bacterium]